MKKFTHISEQLRSLMKTFDAKLLQNIGWLSMGMLVNRVLRLAITVVVARIFSPGDYGLVALIFTAHEILGFFMQRCTQVKLIQAPKEDLPVLCETTNTLNWMLGGALLVVQIILSFVLSAVYDAPEMILPLCLLGLVHVQLPFAMVQAGLNIRSNKMKLVAQIEVGQTFLEALIVLVLIFSGAGIWSLLLPKLVTPILWIWGHRKHNNWRASGALSLHRCREIFAYSANLLVVDGMQMARQNFDYLIIGFALGVEALGLYFFAYNAGLGIASSFSNAISSALLPHFCEKNDDKNEIKVRFRRGVMLTALLIGVLVTVQATFAPWYVPIVFGEAWVERGAVALIMMLCLVALPKAIIDACSQYLRASDHPKQDLVLQGVFTLLTVGAILAGAFWSLTMVAVATLTSYALFSVFILGYCLFIAKCTRQTPRGTVNLLSPALQDVPNAS